MTDLSDHTEVQPETPARLSRGTRRTIGIVLTLSLALNFFAAGWFVSRQVLDRGPFGGPPPPPFGRIFDGRPPGGQQMTEQVIVERIAGVLSPEGASLLLKEFHRHEGELRRIIRQLAGVHGELEQIIAANPIDRDRLRTKMEELGGLMSLRMSIMADISEKVIPGLSPADRQRMLLLQPPLPGPGFREGPPAPAPGG